MGAFYKDEWDLSQAWKKGPLKNSIMKRGTLKSSKEEAVALCCLVTVCAGKFQRHYSFFFFFLSSSLPHMFSWKGV